jgi:hypothetical protein
MLAPTDRDDDGAIKPADLTIEISQMRKLFSALHPRKREPLCLAEAEEALGKGLPEVLKKSRDLGGIIKADADGGADQEPATCQA